MFRRLFLAGLAVVLAAGAALPAAAREFASERIRVTVVGSGPDVVLIPGLTSSPRVWERAVRDVPGYRYHLVQLNGFAGLPAGGAAQGPVVQPAAGEIVRYIREARLTRPAVVGHSLGGTAALMIGARHPELAGRIMAVDSFPWMGVVMGPPGATSESLRPTAEGMAAGMARSTPEQWRAAMQMQVRGMVRSEAARAAVMEDGVASDYGVAGRAMGELVTTDLRSEMGRIRAPLTVLYAHGDQYPTTAEQTDALFAREYAGVSGARLIRVPDANHFIMLDQPERFAAELRSFLTR